MGEYGFVGVGVQNGSVVGESATVKICSSICDVFRVQSRVSYRNRVGRVIFCGENGSESGNQADIEGQLLGETQNEQIVDRNTQLLLENEAFLEWLQENGVYVSELATWGQAPHALVIATETTDDFEPSGRGLLARKGINQGECLFKIPERLAMTKDKARDTFGQHIITDGTDDFISLALLLIHERAKGSESFWKHYLSVIPKDEDLKPLFRWTAEEKEVLRGSPTLIAAESLAEKIKREYAATYHEIILPNASVFKVEAYTQDAWEWAFAVLFSRAICFPSTRELALVPYADLLNHNSFCSTFFDVQDGGLISDERSVVLYSDRQYSQTEQVYVTYGQKSNAELLLLYGFVVERNPFDSVEIAVSLSESDSLYKRKLQYLKDVGTDPMTRFPLFQDRYPMELIEFLRFCCASEAELDADTDFGQFVSAANEDAVANALMDACKDALAGYPTSIDDDQALMRDRKMYNLLSQNVRWALKHRRSEKRILLKTISNIERERKKPAYMFLGTRSEDSGTGIPSLNKRAPKDSIVSVGKLSPEPKISPKKNAANPAQTALENLSRLLGRK
mmetsp:Transcript_8895/g.16028  ORF Transcript_8895/g.16028 Transcript_8895/m.16028 type:complete len:566 (-) Transcript_8895:879-2576(-)